MFLHYIITIVFLYVYIVHAMHCVYILLLIQWASYVRNVVRNSKGLPIIITLLEANHDPVIRAATTALRNLAIDPRNKAIIGRSIIHYTV